MDNLPFDWPIIGFGCAKDVHYGNALVCFHNADQFGRCYRRDLERAAWTGMVLVDNAGRSWEITGVRRRHDLSIGKRISLFLSREYSIEVDLAEREPISFQELMMRVIETIDANPHEWRDDEAIAGESGPPRDEMEMLEEIKDRVRKAQSVDELIQFGEIYPA